MVIPPAVRRLSIREKARPRPEHVTRVTSFICSQECGCCGFISILQMGKQRPREVGFCLKLLSSWWRWAQAQVSLIPSPLLCCLRMGKQRHREVRCSAGPLLLEHTASAVFASHLFLTRALYKEKPLFVVVECE